MHEPQESAAGDDGSQATGTSDLQRRKLQKAGPDPQAVYHDAADGSAKLCPIHQCEPNPCQNGGVCTPSVPASAKVRFTSNWQSKRPVLPVDSHGGRILPHVGLMNSVQAANVSFKGKKAVLQLSANDAS